MLLLALFSVSTAYNIELAVDALAHAAWGARNPKVLFAPQSRAAVLDSAPRVSRVAARASARHARQEELTFGELVAGESGILRALHGLPARYAIGSTPSPSLVDLGSGTGKLAFAVALAGLRGRAGDELEVGGVELVRERHELALQARAVAAAQVLAFGNCSTGTGAGTGGGRAGALGAGQAAAAWKRVARADLRHGDLRQGGFEHATHLFACNCLFSRALMRALLEAAGRGTRLRCLVTVRELPADLNLLLQTGARLRLLPNVTGVRVRTAWGRDVPVFYYCRPPGDYTE